MYPVGMHGLTLASMTKTERQQYKIAGPATWELIRAAYLGGESAWALAERFGVSEHAIRERISVEKWTKHDYALALEARGVIRESKSRISSRRACYARRCALAQAAARAESEDAT